MNLSTNTIKQLFNILNKECFNNELEPDFQFKLNKRTAAGTVSYSRKYGKVTSFQISSIINWTYEDLKNVILHEMIHVYEIQILKQKPAHSYAFLKEMNRINHLGYNVTTKHQLNITKKRKANIVIGIIDDHYVFMAMNMSYNINNNFAQFQFNKFFKNGFKIINVESESLNKIKIKRKINGSYYCFTKDDMINYGFDFYQYV